jgi:hypothetical protein
VVLGRLQALRRLPPHVAGWLGAIVVIAPSLGSVFSEFKH